jgi:hypothetical protein
MEIEHWFSVVVAGQLHGKPSVISGASVIKAHRRESGHRSSLPDDRKRSRKFMLKTSIHYMIELGTRGMGPRLTCPSAAEVIRHNGRMSEAGRPG